MTLELEEPLTLNGSLECETTYKLGYFEFEQGALADFNVKLSVQTNLEI